MVVKMRSDESNSSRKADAELAIDLRLPDFETAQREHRPSRMSWSQAIDFFAETRADYMRHFDSPEARWRSKNPARFTLP